MLCHGLLFCGYLCLLGSGLLCSGLLCSHSCLCLLCRLCLLCLICRLIASGLLLSKSQITGLDITRTIRICGLILRGISFTSCGINIGDRSILQWCRRSSGLLCHGLLFCGYLCLLGSGLLCSGLLCSHSCLCLLCRLCLLCLICRLIASGLLLSKSQITGLDITRTIRICGLILRGISFTSCGINIGDRSILKWCCRLCRSNWLT